MAFALAAVTCAPIIANDVRRVVHFALRFEFGKVDIARTFAVLAAVRAVTMAHSALQISAGAAFRGVGHESLHLNVCLICNFYQL